MTGDATAWITRVQPSAPKASCLVLANGDPAWHCWLIRHLEPAFLAMDVDATWALYRPKELRFCIERAHLVTVTSGDARRLPSACLLPLKAESRFTLIKEGEAGVRLLASKNEHRLRPPKVTGEVLSDVGAGDLLLGLMAGQLSSHASELTTDLILSAYDAACPVMSIFLKHHSAEILLKQAMA